MDDHWKVKVLVMFFPLQQNISLSAPIMSRFDLFFVLVDDCNEVTDYAIARRIVDLHSHKEQAVERVYSMVSHMPLMARVGVAYCGGL